MIGLCSTLQKENVANVVGFEKTFLERTKLRSLADHLDWRLARTKAFCPRMINSILLYKGYFRHPIEHL